MGFLLWAEPLRLPPPLWGRVGVGGRGIVAKPCRLSRPPPPTPPHKGEGRKLRLCQCVCSQPREGKENSVPLIPPIALPCVVLVRRGRTDRDPARQCDASGRRHCRQDCALSGRPRSRPPHDLRPPGSPLPPCGRGAAGEAGD